MKMVQELNLCAEVENRLIKQGIKTVKDLEKLYLDDLLEIRNLCLDCCLKILEGITNSI